MKKSNIEKIKEIYKKSNLSILKFAQILNKDRRTITKLIDNDTKKEPSEEIKENICKFFRYPKKIFNENIQGEDFYHLLTNIPQEEICIIDEGYVGGLKYIIEHEKDKRLVINPAFPGPIFRDAVVPRVYKKNDSHEIKKLKDIRVKNMLEYSYEAQEWYSIKSLLLFCFSEIGNFYKKDEKIKILSLMIDTFSDNYNKSLFLFDSFSKKIYGIETSYVSINLKNNFLFFKAPLESLIVEIHNSTLVQKMHRHFTKPSDAPNHIKPSDGAQILSIFKQCLELNNNILQAITTISKETNYIDMFKNNLSVSLQSELSKNLR